LPGDGLKIGIIGAGWYGAHIGFALAKAGHEVIIFEKNADIFSQISGKFGIRLHLGPHYPRSEETRKHCRKGFDKFKATYPELLVPHLYSIYALGISDANKEPSTINFDHFKRVCEESPTCREIDTAAFGYQNLIGAFTLDEPSLAIGERLRETFRRYLRNAKIDVRCNYTVQKIERQGSQTMISNGDSTEAFEIVINATSYQSFFPKDTDFPFDLDVVYQPCLALVYKDSKPGDKPISMIVMDGWFPCLMPYQEHEHEDGKYDNTYIMTHGKWTIMGSYSTPQEANVVFEKLDDDFVERSIKKLAEEEMRRFWPAFNERFTYIGWKGTVLAKLKTKKEFRGAITFEKEGVIHVFPGKINNIFDAEEEVKSLLSNHKIRKLNGYNYVTDGVLDVSMHEISEKPEPNEKNTCTLQTYQELESDVQQPIQSHAKNQASFWYNRSAPPPKDKRFVHKTNTFV